MEYVTDTGEKITDDMLEAEAEVLERGERPEGWKPQSEARQISATVPVWIIHAADAEAARLNISRRAVFNVWLADKAEQANAHRRELATA